MNQTCTFNFTSTSPQLTAAIRSLTPLILMNCQILGSYPADKSSYVYQQSYSEYDFIIVGAGSAGSTIAGRLSEIPAWKVLLIEAGTDPPINSDIPFLYPTLRHSAYDWNYTTEVTGDTCLAFPGNRCTWPRGKALGGSSSINTLVAIRGNPRDYDYWESLGNPGWGYKHVLKYFKKLERLRVSKYKDEAAHGYSGKVFEELSTNKTVYDITEAKNYIANFATKFGYKIVEDINAHNQAGITFIPCTLRNNVRWNTAKAYLEHAKDRRNLTLMKGTMVTKILINDRNKAYGVEVCKNGKYKRIYCRKEVIVSAGAINSPQLLMLSGIGPQNHLSKFKIKVKQNLCVGCNLRDHLSVHSYIGAIQLESYKKNLDISYILKQYLIKRSDIGTGFDTCLFFNTTGYQSDYPNIQVTYTILPMSTSVRSIYEKVREMKPSIKKETSAFTKDDPLFQMDVALLKPKSQGRIFLNSRDPFEHPKIFTGYLTEKDDLYALIEALRVTDTLVRSKAFKQYGTMQSIPILRCLLQVPYSDKYYECLIRHFGTTKYHPAGTCKMGPSKDPDAVVSSELKVHGIQGMRVADASIMPQVPNANLNIPVIMIGEKVSDMIKKDWS
ncbi:glucose dehydrogenase [FAD, quinone]-like [Planococcus citri]|uniref:glucose dehydrogenase [FAD, quinone]-like n=1 Tax=Planococcus citri TaxID=170843 RepID=UPI0031FA3B9B